MTDHNAIIADWALPPGATISHLLHRKAIARTEFSELTGLTHFDVARLISGQMPVDSLVAQELAKVLGGSATFWLTRESNYREALEKKSQLNPENWLKVLPIREMKAWGWMPRAKDDFQSALDFFGVSSPRDWHCKYVTELGEVAFRTANAEARMGPVSAWLRRAEHLATNVACDNWNAHEFKDSLSECKTLTVQREPAEFLPLLSAICARNGVALVVARSPAGSGISGATRFLSRQKAMLCLSFRNLSDDHFWFTFFHEAGHLILHSGATTIVEIDQSFVTGREKEANDFARDLLVPPESWSELFAARGSRFEIARIARKLGVSPGILVGQLQKDGALAFNRMNKLKRRFKWSSLGI